SDLVVGRLSGGGVEPDAIYLNTSSTSPSFFRVDELGSSLTASVIAADFDLDGLADVIAIDTAGGHRLYKGSGAANIAFLLHEQQFTSPAAMAAALGDLNGDGRPDVAIAGNDAVHIFLNDGRGNLGRGDETAPSLELIGAPTVSVVV